MNVRRRVLVLTSLLLTTLSTAGVRADEFPRTELSVLFGASLLDASRDDLGFALVLQRDFERGLYSSPGRTRLGGSLVGAVRVGRYVNERAAFELGLSLNPSHELSMDAGCPYCRDLIYWPYPLAQRSVAYGYDAAFTYDVVGGGTRPFLSFGAGGVTYAFQDYSEKDFRINMGAGVKLGHGRLRGRLEVVDHVTLDHFLTQRTEHDVQVRGGVAVRIP
jgi:hypothetical protein